MHRYLRFANTIRKKNKGSARPPRPGEAPLGASAQRPARHWGRHTAAPDALARHWARRPAQRLASHWGPHAAAPDALKTGHWKQTCTDFYVLRTQYERKIKARRVRQGQARRLSARRPAQRPASHWGRHAAAPDALKTGHCKQTCTEFNVLQTQYERQIKARLHRQGQATRLSAHRPAQRAASRWGRHTAAPDALKTGHCKQTFTTFKVLPTQYDTEKENRRLRQGQATRLSAHRPAQRAASRWGRHTAAPNALKTGHCKQTFTTFKVLPTQYDTEKENRRLRQGQATRLSAHRPAQRAASRWGRHTAAPDALKTGRCKQTFTHFNVLPTQYDREKKDRRLCQGQATRLSAHRPAQRAAARKHS